MKKNFNKSIKKIIRELDYVFYVVQQDESISCTCINQTTLQADPNCEKCLGTGYKIKIKKVKGVGQDTGSPEVQRTSQGLVIGKQYYLEYKYHIAQNNIIVDEDEAFNVFKVSLFKSFDGEKIYRQCLTIPKKLDNNSFMKNFHKLIER